jgi:hypothetical protein
VPLPEPRPGLVIRYSYLWAEEADQGREEGVKDRPCAIIVVTEDQAAARWVTVLPVTHSPPSDASLAIEIPSATKQRLRLDEERSWVVLNESNRFKWPGPDLRPVRRGDLASIAYGQLPGALFDRIRREFVAAARGRRVRAVSRTE